MSFLIVAAAVEEVVQRFVNVLVDDAPSDAYSPLHRLVVELVSGEVRQRLRKYRVYLLVDVFPSSEMRAQLLAPPGG